MTQTETKTMERPWECEDCGLVHNHYSDIDHNLRAITLGPSEIIRNLEYNERCHCGWHELAHKIEEGTVTMPSGLEEYVLKATEKLQIPEPVEEEIKRLNTDTDEVRGEA